MTEEEIDELRRPILETLAMLRESYDKAAKPYIDRLIEIESLRPRRYLFREGDIDLILGKSVSAGEPHG